MPVTGPLPGGYSRWAEPKTMLHQGRGRAPQYPSHPRGEQGLAGRREEGQSEVGTSSDATVPLGSGSTEGGAGEGEGRPL